MENKYSYYRRDSATMSTYLSWINRNYAQTPLMLKKVSVPFVLSEMPRDWKALFIYWKARLHPFRCLQRSRSRHGLYRVL